MKIAHVHDVHARRGRSVDRLAVRRRATHTTRTLIGQSILLISLLRSFYFLFALRECLPFCRASLLDPARAQLPATSAMRARTRHRRTASSAGSPTSSDHASCVYQVTATHVRRMSSSASALPRNARNLPAKFRVVFRRPSHAARMVHMQRPAAAATQTTLLLATMRWLPGDRSCYLRTIASASWKPCGRLAATRARRRKAAC